MSYAPLPQTVAEAEHSRTHSQSAHSYPPPRRSSPSSLWSPRSRSNRRRSRVRAALVVLFCILAALAFVQVGPKLRANKATAEAVADDIVMTSATPAPTRTPLSLRDYLRDAKAAAIEHLQRGEGSDGQDARPLVLVMGNGAGDLDSLTSAFSLAYFLTFYPHDSLPLRSPLPANARYAPLIQTNRSDAHLRPENTASTTAAGIEQQDILYLSDLTDSDALRLDLSRSAQLSPSHGTYLALVDHPQLELPWISSAHDGASERRVVAIVDHHADAGKHADAALRVFRLPESDPTGSAQSIVVELFASALNRTTVPRSLADLAISTVLIDTDNLRPAPRGRASKTDFAAVEALLPLSSFADADSKGRLSSALLAAAPDEVRENVAGQDDTSIASTSTTLSAQTSSIFEILAASKSAISHLSTLDLLKRDYKSSSFTLDDLDGAGGDASASAHTAFQQRYGREFKAGFSSVNMGLPMWLHRGAAVHDESAVSRAWAEWWPALVDWMQAQQLDVAVVGTSFRDEEKDTKHVRELVLALRGRGGGGGGGGDDHDSRVFSSILRDLEDPESTLDLITPWKGARLISTGKKERVSGIDKNTHVVEAGAGVAAQQQRPVYAQVWKQGNAKANRKVYLPRVMAAIGRAMRGL